MSKNPCARVTGLIAMMGQSSVVTQGPGVLHPPGEVLSSRATIAWSGTGHSQLSAPASHTRPVPPPSLLQTGQALQSCVCLHLPPHAHLACTQHQDDVTQRYRVTRDCGYCKTPLCIKGLGMVPEEQRKKFPFVLSSNLESHLQCHCNPNSCAVSGGG